MNEMDNEKNKKGATSADDDGFAERMRNTVMVLRRFAEENLDETEAAEICALLPDIDDE